MTAGPVIYGWRTPWALMSSPPFVKDSLQDRGRMGPHTLEPRVRPRAALWNGVMSVRVSYSRSMAAYRVATAQSRHSAQSLDQAHRHSVSWAPESGACPPTDTNV
jgi:hypothetical protein